MSILAVSAISNSRTWLNQSRWLFSNHDLDRQVSQILGKAAIRETLLHRVALSDEFASFAVDRLMQVAWIDPIVLFMLPLLFPRQERGADVRGAQGKRGGLAEEERMSNGIRIILRRPASARLSCGSWRQMLIVKVNIRTNQ